MSEYSPADPNYKIDRRPPEPATKATELARLTREQGMGLLMGKFPKAMVQAADGEGFIFIKGFIKGEEVKTKNPWTTETDFSFKQIATAAPFPRDLTSTAETHRQTLVITRYSPPAHTTTRQEGGFLRKKRITEEQIDSYNGKHGENGWIQYVYIQPEDPCFDFSRRPGTELHLHVTVPPDIAKEIDAQVNANPYFVDTYQKALYPDLIGENPETHVKRIPAAELLVVDCRENPKNTQGTIIPYPQPLPY